MTIDIPSLVVAAGGELVGKIRLQKVVYLLDQIGIRSGFSYEYHHYGPYSEELADCVDGDIIFRHLEAEQRRRQSDGVPYVVYRASEPGEGEPLNGHLSADQIHFALAEMQKHSATILELAATIHWLWKTEGYEDWRSELIRRKGAKTQRGRDLEAFKLLQTLGLPPAVDAPRSV